MHPLDGLAQQMTWAASNIAYNLDFIPDDKLNWKAAPSAKSALEIVNHACGGANAIADHLCGAGFGSTAMEPATDRASAKSLLSKTGERYAGAIREFDMARMGETVELPFGSFPMTMFVTMGPIDMIHHHGQIAYIETLLGDSEDHFKGMA